MMPPGKARELIVIRLAPATFRPASPLVRQAHHRRSLPSLRTPFDSVFSFHGHQPFGSRSSLRTPFDSPLSLARHERAKRVEWWRRGESNPRPNKSHSSFYVCSQALKDSPPPLPPVRATLVARILLVLAPPPASPGLAPACYRRLYPLTSFRVET